MVETIERQSKVSKLGVHVGNMLMRAASEYNSLHKTVLEGVQNAIDAKASVVFVGFDLQDRISVIADNGLGVSVDKFEAAMMAIGQSQKVRQRDALGKFGIGLISPLDKCQYFEFISRPGRRKPINAWVFARKRIEESVSEPDIPMISLEEMPTLEATFEPEAKKLGATWNTVVRMHGITTDRTVSRLTIEKLADDIKARFGDAMRAKNTVCHLFIRDASGTLHRVKVEPFVYTGEPVEGSPFVIEGDRTGKAGRITIELLRAVQQGGKRNGQIKVSESKGAVFGVKLSDFLAQVRRDLGYDTKNSFEELASGYFEGLIRADGLELNVKRDSDRGAFEVTDGLFDFVVALDSWYDTVGRQFYHGERDRARDDRYRDLTKHSLQEVQAILESRSDFQEYIQGIRENVEAGLIGQGHGEKPSQESDTDRTTRIKRKGTSRPAGGKRITCPPGDGGTRDGDMPFGQVDRSGRRRAVVRNDSVGLWIEVTEFELSNDLWRFDAATGKLLFNCSNHVWAELDGASSETRRQYHDQWIVHLQKWVITQVLAMLQLPAERREDFAELSRGSARLYADLIIKPNKASLKRR